MFITFNTNLDTCKLKFKTNNVKLSLTEVVTSKWNIVSSFLSMLFSNACRIAFSSTLVSSKRMHFSIDGFLVILFSFSYILCMYNDFPISGKKAHMKFSKIKN